MTKPLLSICIPTFNRAEYLKKSLDSLMSQDRFSEVEVVISDNCSTDNTEEVCNEFIQKYPNIIYHRNLENIHDRNFPTVLMKGHGIYRKLVNDNTLYCDDYLPYLLGLVEKYKDYSVTERPQIVFLNGGRIDMNPEVQFEGSEIEDFVRIAGYRFTWIGGFGLWEEDCNNLELEFHFCDTKLWQTYKTLRILDNGRNYLMFNRKICDTAVPKQKDLSYGIYTVFYKNFLELLLPYIMNGKLSNDCIKYVKKDLLFNYFGRYMFVRCNHKQKNNYGREQNFKELIFDAYKTEPYYPKFKIWLFFYLGKLHLQDANKKMILVVKGMLQNTELGRVLLGIKRKLKLRLY